MSDEQARLEFAKWLLERNLHWISAAEVKTGVVVGLDTAMLGVLATAFGALPNPSRSLPILISCGCAAVLLGLGIFCAFLSVRPWLAAPHKSLIFFGRISERSAADFSAAFKASNISALVDDCLLQIHRNAEIASSKYSWIRASTVWSFLAIAPWAYSVGAMWH